MRFQVQRFITKLKFISQKNFDFICQNRAFLRSAQTHEKTHENKKSRSHLFSVRLCVFKCKDSYTNTCLTGSLPVRVKSLANIGFLSTPKKIQYCFNVVFLFYSFLVITVVLQYNSPKSYYSPSIQEIFIL